MSEKNMKENKMATWPVGKLLFSMGIPSVFSMMIQALYNVVDSIYISSYSKDAMFAIGISTPLQMIGLSIALGGAAGVTTMISRRLGEGNKEEANKIASVGFVLTAIHTLIVFLLGMFVAKPFLGLFSNRPEIIAYGFSYLSIVMCVCFGQQFSMLFERIFQGQGNMVVPMFAQLIGALTNIILDPILIFGKFGLPSMGIVGAAVATVAGQILSMTFLVIMLCVKTPAVYPHFSMMKLKMKRVRDIYQIGLPAMVMQMIGSITTTAMNSILVQFTEDAVTSLSLYFKLQSFIFMPLFGFNHAALPILSFNYGARNQKRYGDTFRLFLAFGEVIMILGTILFVFFPAAALSFFETDASLLATAEMVLRTIGLHFVFAAPNIVMTTSLQSFGQGTLSMVQSICRQLLLLIPIAWLLSHISLQAVFYAYPIAEIIVFAIFVPIVAKTWKKHFAEAVEETAD